MNAFVERWIQSLQHEAIDHFIVFGEKHFDYIVSEYAAYYLDRRPHQGIGNVPLRTTRANWCDGTMLFWCIRQRTAEWQRGGDPLCVLAIDVDNRQQIAQSCGPVALHFMMRAQMLHLDSTLRDMDIVGRTCNSRIIVVLPRTTLASLTPILRRLRDSMDRFAYPTSLNLLEYSVSVGVAEVKQGENASQIVQRAEVALSAAQSAGNGHFFIHDGQRVTMLVLDEEITDK